MWIFCCGMIRAGSTLQYQVISHLVEMAGFGKRAGYFTKDAFSDFYRSSQDLESCLVVKMHDYLALAQSLLSESRAKAFYSYRDLRDVAVSSMKKFGISFEELMENGWLDHTISVGEKWRSCSNVLISRYEDLAKRPAEEFLRMAEYVNLELSESELDNLLSIYSIESQLERIKSLKKKENMSNRHESYDEFSLLHPNHIYKGEIGGWKGILSSNQIDILNARYKLWLHRNGYLV